MKKYLVVAFAFILVLGLVGCNNDVQNEATGDLENVENTPDMKSPKEMWNDMGVMNDADKELAQKCADIAVAQEHVEGAQTYAMGDTVYVALRVEDNVDDEKVIKEVRNALENETADMNFNIVSDYGAFEQMKKGTKGVKGNKDNVPTAPETVPTAPEVAPTK